MARSYSTPGVYVEEVSTLPPSVAEVSTAIPAFLGYTKSGPKLTPTRISTIKEYTDTFGGAPDMIEKVTYNDQAKSVVTTWKSKPPLLYYSLRLYFDNGGGPCYVVSLDSHAATPALDDFKAGLDALAKEDEPTLVVMPDATRLDATMLGQAEAAALKHCADMTDRFAILDLQDGQPPLDFRNKLTPPDYLSYGAAYTPHIVTALTAAYREEDLPVDGVSPAADPAPRETVFTATVGGLKVTYRGAAAAKPKVKVLASQPALSFTVETDKGPLLTVSLAAATATKTTVERAWDEFADKAGFDLEPTGTVQAADQTELAAQPPPKPSEGPAVKLKSLKGTNDAAYNLIKAELARHRVILPPSGAMAGIYARVDRERGVWKAPANVGVASAVDLTQTITEADQEGLNIDVTAGKSINALRTFTGRGTLVWGARTLAGNDNEWRYVPVRRLFIMIEESAKKSTAFAVFEPNNATTWLKVKAMIESFLYGLWERGALAGSKPESAYFVNVGLGTTMTAQDVLEGRLIVEIGIAAVRPAEFIILRFTHKLPEA